MHNWRSNVVCLVIIIDRKLNWNQNTEMVIKKVSKKVSFLYRIRIKRWVSWWSRESNYSPSFRILLVVYEKSQWLKIANIDQRAADQYIGIFHDKLIGFILRLIKFNISIFTCTRSIAGIYDGFQQDTNSMGLRTIYNYSNWKSYV